MKSLDHQVAGDHYRKYAIQPAEYNARNKLSFLAGNVVKYVTRYKDKGGAEDIRKAMHYLELILEFEYPTISKAVVNSYAPHVPPAAAPTGPELILRLNSEDADQIGDLTNGNSHQPSPQRQVHKKDDRK